MEINILKIKEELTKAFLRTLKNSESPKSVTYKDSVITISTEDFSLSFKVELWDKTLEQAVIKYINE